MKKIIRTTTIALIILMSLMIVSGSAKSIDDFNYEINDNTVTITGYLQEISGTVVIPETIEGYPVTSIAPYAFQNCESLKSIVIPDSVTSIGEYAFQSCLALSNVTLPDSLTSIQSGTFQSCESLSDIIIPGSIKLIGDSAFSYCTSMNSCTIEEGVEEIGAMAFLSCTGLERISVPSSVSRFKARALSFCDNLTDLYYRGTAGQWESISFEWGNDWTDNVSIHYSSADSLNITSHPDSVTVIGNSPEESSTITFRVIIRGTETSYQWQYKTPKGVWKNCTSKTEGYNKSVLKVVACLARDGYQYRCIVTDTQGNRVTSNSAYLDFITITEHPVNTNITASETAIFKVTATAENATYQWQYKTPKGDWKNCSSKTKGYNTDTLYVAGVSGSVNRDGYQYRCVINVETVDIFSNSAVLSVLAIKTDPSPANILGTSEASFTVAATGNSLTYQWQYRTSSSGTWKNCSYKTAGYNTDTIKVVGVSGSTNRNRYQYRCLVSDGKNTVSSKTAILTVFAIKSHPTDIRTEAGSNAVFKVNVTGDTLSYQWQYMTPKGNWKNSTSKTPGYQSDTLKVFASSVRNGYQYRCIVTSGNEALTSDSAVLTVY